MLIIGPLTAASLAYNSIVDPLKFVFYHVLGTSSVFCVYFLSKKDTLYNWGGCDDEDIDFSVMKHMCTLSSVAHALTFPLSFKTFNDIWSHFGDKSKTSSQVK